MRYPGMEVVDGCSEVLVRTIHTTKKHPQVGYIFNEGKKVEVYIGFYLDMPVWRTAYGPDDPEYVYCQAKTMPIDEDPDYIGEDVDEEEIFLAMQAP